MHWENSTPSWANLQESEIPGELVDGIERLAADGDLLKARLRWRPHATAAKGFLTRDRLLGLEGHGNGEVAVALASFAAHLFEQGECEAKFEAQIQRKLEQGENEGAAIREWRSITFYIAEEPSENEVHFDFEGDQRMPDFRDSRSDQPAQPRPPQDAALPPIVPLRLPWSEYTQRFQLLESNPVAFAILTMQEGHARELHIMRELLGSTATRLDGMMNSQSSSTRYMNQALQTLTRGAGEVAGIGVQLFQQGLEGQARVAKMEHESEVSKERTELMRDAVKQGSMLLQAIVMSQANKQRTQPPAPAGHAQPHASTPTPTPTPTPDPIPRPAPEGSPADRALEASTTQLLAQIDDMTLARLRKVAPAVVDLFEDLRAGPISASRIRALIQQAQSGIQREELEAASAALDDDTRSAFGRVLVQVLM